MTRCAIWVSAGAGDTEDRRQIIVLREWARECDLELVMEFSIPAAGRAQPGGSEYDAAIAELVDRARLGQYPVILLWALGQLSRRGADDALEVLQQLVEYGVDVRSRQEPWLRTNSPETRELLCGILTWRGQEAAARRSEQIKAGLARRKADGKPIGGRKPGAKDRTQRNTDGYATAWAEGGKRREAIEGSRPGQAEQSGI